MNPKVEEIINQLNTMEVDGETMQYILEKTGMFYQMLYQLVMTSSQCELEDIIKERYFVTGQELDI